MLGIQLTLDSLRFLVILSVVRFNSVSDSDSAIISSLSPSIIVDWSLSSAFGYRTGFLPIAEVRRHCITPRVHTVLVNRTVTINFAVINVSRAKEGYIYPPVHAVLRK